MKLDATRDGQPSLETIRLSYKFQRLRERLRAAVGAGELSGKLPGERLLAKKFHVNAKTLSKALTDLAAEGVLERSVGRGTFVRGSAPAGSAVRQWLVICDPGSEDCESIGAIRKLHSDMNVVTDISAIRPSFINQFDAVIDFGATTPDEFLRGLVVRNVPVVVVGREPRTYSTHAVVFDAQLATGRVGRTVLLAGHRRVAVVERDESTTVVDGLRSVAAQLGIEAMIERTGDLSAALAAGATAVVCDSVDRVVDVRRQLDRHGARIPDDVSLVGIGVTTGEPPCGGVFLDRSVEAAEIVSLIDGKQFRPTTLWLAGRAVDRGTVADARETDDGVVAAARN